MIATSRMAQRKERRLECSRGQWHRCCRQRFRRMISLVSMFCVILLPSVTGQAYWYDPPCLNHNFSWTTHSGGTQKCKLSMVEVLGTQDEKYCANPLDSLTDGTEPSQPPPVENVEASYYTTRFVPGTSSWEWAGIWSGLNITFQLGLQGAGKVRGVLLSMKSLSPDSDDYLTMYCQAYDFLQPLSVDALVDQQGSPVQLFHDCWRGQKPGMEYEYALRTLPVLDTSASDPDGDTAVTFQYRTPSCFAVPDDYLCKDRITGQRPPQIALCSYWRPQYFTVTANYNDLSVAMELGPAECGFDSFRLAAASRGATSGVNLWADGFIQVTMANVSHFETFAYGRNITYIKVDLKGVSVGQRVVVVAAWPTQNTCFGSNGISKPCSVTLSAVLNIIENPCLSGPCSSIEVCEPSGHRFSCHCKPGYMREDSICVRNPCEVSNDTHVASNPCRLGSCAVSNDKRSYSCSCPDGWVFVNGTCQEIPNDLHELEGPDETTHILPVDACIPNPCGNGICHHQIHPLGQVDYSCDCQPGYIKRGNTCKADSCKTNPCGRHSSCKHSDQSLRRTEGSVNAVPFTCNCNFGYHYDDMHHSCEVSVGTLVAVILTSFFSAFLLLFLLLAWRRRKSSRTLFHRAVPCMGIGENNSDLIVDGSSVPSRTPSLHRMSTLSGFRQERTEIIQPMKRIKTVLFYSMDHPLHEETVQRLATFLNEYCMCDVILPLWCAQDIARRGVNEWITFVLDWADKVILLCSKGSGIAWRAYSSASPTQSDLLTRAVCILLQGGSSVGVPERCCVAYLDYSSKDDVPPPLAVGAIYRLMKHMDAFFFRLHDMKQGSAEWELRATDLEEESYAGACPEGAALHHAIQQMREYQKAEPDWFHQRRVLSHTGTESQTTFEETLEVDDKEYDEALKQFLSTPTI
ncbi:uncharacterized protein LOC110982101 isoform X2 [Acanthaster planci]|uniref:Uncharacterized protein LOC110982101 isoform X2 n=1 Tax=Acanthaster planci TaxID=133434 RepID=A0A8B7YXG3_ACAPL|nr:uncharacterized protein LOC110982101 isoform X2 [Acanthaster planci]